MPQIIDTPAPPANLFGAPGPRDSFAAIADPDGGTAGMLAEDRRQDRPHPPARRQVGHPGRRDLPAQFVVHDLDFRRASGPERRMLDLGLIYGDGPKHDAFCYQVRPRPAPAGTAAGRPRGRRQLAGLGARATCRAPARNLDRAVEPGPRCWCRTPSRTQPLLGQVQVLWALMHNAVAQHARRDPQRRRRLRAGAADQLRHLSRRDPPRRARHLADAAVPRPLRRRRCRRLAPAARGRTPPGRAAGARAGARDLRAERPAGDRPAQPRAPDHGRAAARHAADRGLAGRLLEVLRHRIVRPAEGPGAGAACGAPLRDRAGSRDGRIPPMVSSCATWLRVRAVGCAR